ncbi:MULTISPECIES: hypothetical protein [Sorangium]|uniref:hypothetical protein n=1 Tax=Sorangium TaxID=39643 RepID=UPI001019F3A7|nr:MULTISPECIES: hypothetical protein [Sorangium]
MPEGHPGTGPTDRESSAHQSGKTALGIIEAGHGQRELSQDPLVDGGPDRGDAAAWADPRVVVSGRDNVRTIDQLNAKSQVNVNG